MGCRATRGRGIGGWEQEGGSRRVGVGGQDGEGDPKEG